MAWVRSVTTGYGRFLFGTKEEDMRSLLRPTVAATGILGVLLAGQTTAQARHPRACCGASSPGNYYRACAVVYYVPSTPVAQPGDYILVYPSTGVTAVSAPGTPSPALA